MPPRRNFLSQFIDWFRESILGQKPEKPTVAKEKVIRYLYQRDVMQKDLAMLNHLQELVTVEKWLISTWKAIPQTTDHGIFYYICCFEIPYQGKQVSSIKLSTGVRTFDLKRSQGVSWGKYQIQVFKADRRSPHWELLYSRNCSFFNANAFSEPRVNAAIAMYQMARQMLTLSLRELDRDKWEHQVSLAIAGWGELEPGKSAEQDDWRLDKK